MLPRKKRKHSKSVIDNINKYVAYVKKHNPKVITRKEFTTQIGIKKSVVNYLVYTLKQKKLLRLEGEVGRLYLVPTVNEDESI